MLRHARLDRYDLRRALPNQLHAPTGQVTYCTVGLRHDVTFGQQAQAKNMRQMTGVGFIAAILQAVVLLDRGGIGQME